MVPRDRRGNVVVRKTVPANPLAIRLLTCSAVSRNQSICFAGSSGYPAYAPWFQIPRRIWK